jgi:integrative and conjugative element protein (TIGR02256 family)
MPRVRALIGLLPRSSGRLLLEPRISEVMDSHRQLTPDASEAGGILLGFRRPPHLHVTDLTEPLPTDERTRFWFRRNHHGHAQAALRHWERTQRTGDYMGEWHTHPEDLPKPSGKDLCEWRILLREQRRPLVFLIVGTKGRWVGVGSGSTIATIECDEID